MLGICVNENVPRHLNLVYNSIEFKFVGLRSNTLYSGNFETPGHVSSVGEPRSLQKDFKRYGKNLILGGGVNFNRSIQDLALDSKLDFLVSSTFLIQKK